MRRDSALTMANTYTQLDFHVVFSTKDRQRVLTQERREDLYRYIWGIHRNLDCKLHRIGGVEDHVHILASLPTTLSVADYVKEVKTGATKWVKHENLFSQFTGWQDGFGAFTVSREHRDHVIEYIKGQPEHHRTVSFLDEYKRLLTDAGIAYDEKYL
jgi:REP element-mobilizing transposase RayT